MPLVNAKEMLNKALKNKYGVPAFNFTNLEQLDAILEICEKLNYPVIIQTSKKAMDYMGISTVVAMVKEKTKHIKTDVCLNLDHGKDFEICKIAIDNGYTNVMIDASDKPFEQNVEETKKVVTYAHKHNVTVEAELGSLKGIEDDKNR
jgi:fructose-bisphosphate aldolase class II